MWVVIDDRLKQASDETSLSEKPRIKRGPSLRGALLGALRFTWCKKTCGSYEPDLRIVTTPCVASKLAS